MSRLSLQPRLQPTARSWAPSLFVLSSGRRTGRRGLLPRPSAVQSQTQRRSDGTLSELQQQHWDDALDSPTQQQAESATRSSTTSNYVEEFPPSPAGLSQRESLARLLDPDYRAQVKNFQLLLTPETLPQLQEGLSSQDYQQLQTIMYDIAFLSHFTADKQEQEQQEDLAEPSSSSSSGRDDGSSSGARADPPSTSQTAAQAHSGDRKPDRDRMQPRRPSLEELRVMQEAKIAVQQLPASFTSYLALLFGGLGADQLSGLTAMIGEPQLSKLESLYQEVRGFSSCSLEDLPTQYVLISKKMEQLQLELTQGTPSRSSSSSSTSGRSQSSEGDDSSAAQNTAGGVQSSSADLPEAGDGRSGVGSEEVRPSRAGSTSASPRGAGSTLQRDRGSNERQGMREGHSPAGVSGRQGDVAGGAMPRSQPQQQPQQPQPQQQQQEQQEQQQQQLQEQQQQQQQEQRRGFLQGLKRPTGSPMRKGLAAKGRLFPPPGEP